MTADEWIERFSAEVGGAPPDEAEITKLLELAGVAAHSSERIAAPIACWIAGRGGLDLDEAIAQAKGIEAEDGAG
jgi:hypothetical protein